MLRSTLLVSLGVAAALTQPAHVPLPTAILVRPDLVLISPMLGAANGDLVTLTHGTAVIPQTLALYLIQAPEGYSDTDYRCRVVWSGVEVGATSVDVTAWPEVWPDAAWRLSPASAPTVDEVGCASLDPDRLGSAPIAPCDRFDIVHQALALSLVRAAAHAVEVIADGQAL